MARPGISYGAEVSRSRIENISPHDIALVMEDSPASCAVEHAAPIAIWRGHGRTPQSAHDSFAEEGPAVIAALTPAGVKLVRQICDEAPGTWFHVRGVADLYQHVNDSSAERAACLLHDVGKLLAPEAFAENVPSPTHRPAPGILTGHVSHGQYLLHRAGLTGVFEDAVLEHHGTMIVADEVTYPGPIPQSSFTAALMVADLLEALASQGSLTPALAHQLLKQRINAKQFKVVSVAVAQKALTTMLAPAMDVCARNLMHR